ncbi:TPA: YsgD/CorL family protein [Enterobacter soli]|uniref:YsgD/CorL family protein n=1 Tax=Enterobacter soli TaxID=885040 RepID=UPI003528976C
MAGGGLRPTGNCVTFRKISLFCNNLLALYVEGQLMPFSVSLRVDATITAGVTCAHDYAKRTFALDTPSRYWLISLSTRNNS